MNINPVSFYMAGNFNINANSSKLPQWLVEKLLALGIDPSQVKTINEARLILKKASENKNDTSFLSDSKRNVSNYAQTSSVETVSLNNADNNNNAVERLKKLAKILGVKYKDGDDEDKIAKDIQNVLDSLFVEAAVSCDAHLYSKLENYQKELNDIVSDLENSSVGTEKVVPYLDLLAMYNKSAMLMSDDKK